MKMAFFTMCNNLAKYNCLLFSDENEDDETRRKRQLSECSGQSAGSVGGENHTLSLAQKFFETRQKVSTRFKSGHVNVSYSRLIINYLKYFSKLNFKANS